jgi:RecJ-like exonuclease
MATNISDFRQKLNETIVPYNTVYQASEHCGASNSECFEKDDSCSSNTRSLIERSCYSENLFDSRFSTWSNEDKITKNHLLNYLNSQQPYYSSTVEATADFTHFKNGVNQTATNQTGEYDTLLSNHLDVKKKRKELDLKMRELYEQEKSDVQIMHDNSVYVTFAYTVLATSVLYYLFVKL